MSGSYAIDSMGANPYLLNALNYPNPYYTQTPVNTTAVSTAAETPVETTVARKKEEKKDGSTAKLIVGTALALGAAYMCKKAYNVGAGTGVLEKIGNGFKQWGQNITNWGKGVKDKVIAPEKFSISKIGEETVCTIPNRRNILRGTEKIGEIGVTAETPKILDSAGKLAEGIKIKNGTFVHEGQTFIVKKGNIVGCEGMSKEAFRDFFTHPKTTENIEGKKKIEEVLAKFMKGETGTVTQYSHTKDGVARLFEQGSDGAFNMKCGISNRFNANSDVVMAYRHNNPSVKTALEDFAKGETKGLKLASAEFTRSDLGTLYITNGEISAIKGSDGKICKKGSEAFDALMERNKDVYENILKDPNCLQNKIYQLA